jgi:transposase-like protein
MVSGNISESPEHKVRLEYEDSEGPVIVLWEPKEGKYLLQTIFDDKSGILDQKLLNLESHSQNEVIEAFMESNGIEPKESVYESVEFHGECPSCRMPSLVRYAAVESKASKIPIMPIYTCKNCGSKSYHLTKRYLKKLITSNKELFENADIEEFAGDEQKFINELEAYIVRVFASKHILKVK